MYMRYSFIRMYRVVFSKEHDNAKFKNDLLGHFCSTNLFDEVLHP